MELPRHAAYLDRESRCALAIGDAAWSVMDVGLATRLDAGFFRDFGMYLAGCTLGRGFRVVFSEEGFVKFSVHG